VDNLSGTLLNLSLLGYVVGAVAGLLFLRAEKLANVFAFRLRRAGCPVRDCLLRALSGHGVATANQSFELLPSLIPYVRFTGRLDPLGSFFGIVVSLLALALSVYSLGYARGFFGRKNVGVLGALFNVLLLTTTLVCLADNAFFFLIAWEVMALSAFCLVSFEHEDSETRKAGVLYFVMSHIGTGCLIVAFLLLFQPRAITTSQAFTRPPQRCLPGNAT